MAWIQVIDPDGAAGELRDIYREIASARGGIADVHRVQSLNARALRAHLELYRAVMFACSTLSRIARERIAVVVSEANRCGYCVAHHSEALRQLGDDRAVVESLGRDELPGQVESRHQALLRRSEPPLFGLTSAPRVTSKACARWDSMTKPFSMRLSQWRISHS